MTMTGTRWTIVQTAHQLFLELGLGATTMPLVAERAGVSGRHPTIRRAAGSVTAA
jgi:AcrR family transcriptional regulator